MAKKWKNIETVLINSIGENSGTLCKTMFSLGALPGENKAHVSLLRWWSVCTQAFSELPRDFSPFCGISVPPSVWTEQSLLSLIGIWVCGNRHLRNYCLKQQKYLSQSSGRSLKWSIGGALRKTSSGCGSWVPILGVSWLVEAYLPQPLSSPSQEFVCVWSIYLLLYWCQCNMSRVHPNDFIFLSYFFKDPISK